MTDYHVTDEKAHAVTQAAIRVEIARKVAEMAHDNLCDSIVYVEQNSGWNPISAFTWDGGAWQCKFGQNDERFARFLDALEVRRDARRSLGSKRAALTRMVRALAVKS